LAGSGEHLEESIDHNYVSHEVSAPFRISLDSSEQRNRQFRIQVKDCFGGLDCSFTSVASNLLVVRSQFEADVELRGDPCKGPSKAFVAGCPVANVPVM
jgi:hypothetical protein